ncbi:MAG: HEAT repeat domain-containing protein [Myxococcota bacterium]
MDGRKRRHTLPAGVLPTIRPEDQGSRVRAKAPPAEAPAPELDKVVAPPPPARRARIMVDELITLRPEETAASIRRLLPLGNFALEEISRSFPGPLWRPSLATDSRLPRPEEVSASAQALVAFDYEAIPYIARLMRHPSSDVRYYAIVLCDSFSTPDLVAPLCRATLDEDRDCRRVALHLLSAYQHQPVYRDALADLRHTASNESQPLGSRRRAISALTQLRDEASAALFVDLLTDDDRGIATASRVGLRVLSAHDFGFLREPWLRWLAARGQEIRIQWLIEGLGDARANIRLLASRELWRLTRFLPALTETSSREDFMTAQHHYERWWSKHRDKDA